MRGWIQVLVFWSFSLHESACYDFSAMFGLWSCTLALSANKAEDGDDCFFALVPYRYRPPTFHVQAWYDEVKDYSFSYPQECNPYCPFKCSGPVCTHYTQVTSHGLHLWSTFGGHLGPDFVSRLQLVWATSSRIGCAVNLCYNMNVWGQIWAKAVYLVCNYSPK